MASTYSSLKIELIGTGDQAGVWGNTTNVNLGDGGAGLEQAIVGMATLVTGDFTANSYTLPYTDTNALQDFRALVLNVTATLSNNGEVIVPAIQKPYLVMNNSVGGFAVTFKVAGQPGVTVPNGYKCYVYNNGTDVIQAADFMPSLVANQVDILAQGDLRLQDASGGQYVAIQAPATIASSYTLTMPTDDGTTNQVLTTDGNGVLSWNSVVNSLSAGTGISLSGSTGSITVTNSAPDQVVSIASGTGISVTGTYPSFTVANSGVTSFSAGTTGLTPNSATTGGITLGGTLSVGNGGTGATTLAANNVLLGNGTSALQTVAPGTSGNVLTSNGTTWVSSTPSSGGTVVIDNKTGAYTVIASDAGKIINCTANSFTVSLTSAASLGSGFTVTIWNTSNTTTNEITIDPNGSETIDNQSTLILRRGEGTQIVSDGTNWQTGSKKTMRAYAENINSTLSRPVATGNHAVAIGANGTTASGASSYAIGNGSQASSTNSFAIGSNSGGSGSQAVTNAGAMALGGSYASGIDSFAAAIADNTSSYGATGANGVAIGQQAKASGTGATAVGYYANATGSYSANFGCNVGTASGTKSLLLGGSSNTASQTLSIALGDQAVSATYGKLAHAIGSFASAGDAQKGTFVLRRATTDATPTILTPDGGAASATNQVTLPNNSTYTFRVQVVGMQKASDGTNTAGYSFEGVIRRGANAAATVLKNSNKTVLQEDVAGWDCNVSADTTNGGLAVTVTGAAATNIRWVATVTTTEVTYA